MTAKTAEDYDEGDGDGGGGGGGVQIMRWRDQSPFKCIQTPVSSEVNRTTLHEM